MQNWIEHIDAITLEYKRSFGKLRADQLNFKPNPTSWSIAQITEHLILINSSYFPIIEAIEKGSYRVPVHGKWRFMTRFFGRFILQSVHPSRDRKIKTVSIWEPTKSDYPIDLVQQFIEHQDQLKRFVERATSRDLKRTIISSPANKHIVYNLEAALDIIVTHERRHLEQARDLLPNIPKL